MNYCPNCGKGIEQNDNYCGSCGFDLINKVEPESTPERHPEKSEDYPTSQVEDTHVNVSAGSVNQISQRYKESFLSTDGRIRRSTYFGRILLIAIIPAILNIMSESSYDDSLMILSALDSILSLFFSVPQTIKRLHDLDMSGWYWLLLFIPFVNLIFGLYLLFRDGTIGSNQYGPDPKGRILK